MCTFQINLSKKIIHINFLILIIIFKLPTLSRNRYIIYLFI